MISLLFCLAALAYYGHWTSIVIVTVWEIVIFIIVNRHTNKYGPSR